MTNHLIIKETFFDGFMVGYVEFVMMSYELISRLPTMQDEWNYFTFIYLQC